jgi:hypothetical protein
MRRYAPRLRPAQSGAGKFAAPKIIFSKLRHANGRRAALRQRRRRVPRYAANRRTARFAAPLEQSGAQDRFPHGVTTRGGGHQGGFDMLATARKLGLVAAAALAFAALSTGPASARWHHWHHGWHHRHFRPAFTFRFGAPYRAYAYGPYCRVRRTVHYNWRGQRVVRVRRVCY